MPLNGLSRAKAASCCGCSHDSEPPSVRPPRRSFTGMRSSSAAARRGPAKRTSTPPSSIHLASYSRASPATLPTSARSEEHTSELQSPDHLVCRLLLEKKKQEALSETPTAIPKRPR